MMRIWLVFVMMGCALGGVSGQENTLNDPALQKPITVWLRLASLEEALSEIRRQTGVSMRCQDALRDMKLAVYVQNRPAREILERIAALFGCQWRQDTDGGYVLYLPDETRRALERAQRDDRAATERALREVVRVAREWLALPPQARAEVIAQHAQTQVYPADASYADVIAELQQTRRTQTREQRVKSLVASYLKGYITADESPPEHAFPYGDAAGSLLHCLSAAGDAVINSLLQGRTVGFSTRPTPGALPLPAGVMLPALARGDFSALNRISMDAESIEGLDIPPPSPPKPNPRWGGLWARLSPWGDWVEFQAVGLIDSDSEPAQRRFLQSEEDILPLPLDEFLAETETWRQWQSWATPAEQWDERLKGRTPLERPKPVYREEMPLLAAHALEWVAWHTGYPVVSDASRYALAPYLEQLDNPRILLSLLENSLWIRFDSSGYLLARHKRFWKLNEFEIPERVVRPLEEKWLAWEWLSLDDYAALASAITDAQARGFTPERRRGMTQFWTAFDNNPLYYQLPALRFWASLGASQRQQALQGEWLLVSTLTLPQRKRFKEALQGDFPPPDQLIADLPDNYRRGLYVPHPEMEGVPSYSDEALRQSPDMPAFRLQAGKPRHQLSVLMEETEFTRSYTEYSVNSGVGRDGVDWKKVFQEASLDHDPAEAQLETSFSVVLQFAAPPRQYEQYVLRQSRMKTFKQPIAP